MAKKEITRLESLLKQTQKNLEKLIKKELAVRTKWTKAYHRYIKAAMELTKITRLGTKKFNNLSEIVNSWLDTSIEMTKERDELRDRIEKEKEEISKLQIKIAELVAKEQASRNAEDEIVSQVFTLTGSVIEALKNRDDYLARHVYTELFDNDGNLRSQITFTNTEQTKRVVAMVSRLTEVLPDKAEHVKRLIEEFFNRFREAIEMDESTKILYNLTSQLLVEKTKFRVGPDFYRFISLELNKDDFPELFEAQKLLRNSLRTKKTDTYIRIFERNSPTEKWVQVKLNV